MVLGRGRAEGETVSASGSTGHAEPNREYIYAWGPRYHVPGLPVLDRKGQRCRVLARGAMNSALVEFRDGEVAVISRNALRRVRP